MAKRVHNFLYSCYLTSPASEEAIALEFWKAYRHFVEGGSIFTFNFVLIDVDHVRDQLRKILRGDLINLDMEKTTT